MASLKALHCTDNTESPPTTPIKHRSARLYRYVSISISALTRHHFSPLQLLADARFAATWARSQLRAEARLASSGPGSSAPSGEGLEARVKRLEGVESGLALCVRTDLVAIEEKNEIFCMCACVLVCVCCLHHTYVCVCVCVCVLLLLASLFFLSFSL